MTASGPRRPTSALFVYGTLRHPPLLAALLGRPVVLLPATLAGHRVAPLAGVAYPGLVPDPDATAVGAVVEVTDGDLVVLDRFEGPAYERDGVDVDVDGVSRPVEVYRFRETGVALDGVWSFDRFLATEAERWVGAADPDDRHPG